MARLAELGDYEFCFSPGESMDLGGGWRTLAEQRGTLERVTDRLAWGDIYARLVAGRAG